MPKDTSEAAKAGVAQRFGDEEGGSESSTDAPEDTTDDEDRFGPENIKEEWTNHSVYLPDGLTAQLDRRAKLLDLDFGDELEMDITKTRHYYPLVIALGLDQLEQTETKDLKERLEQIDG